MAEASLSTTSSSSYEDGTSHHEEVLSYCDSSEFDSESDEELEIDSFDSFSSYLLSSSPDHTPVKRPRLCVVGDTKTSLSTQSQDPSFGIDVLQSLVLILQYALKYHLSSKGILDLILLLKVHVPIEHKLPRSVYALRQFFLRAFPESKGSLHAYCSECHCYLSEDQVECEATGCTGRADNFILTNIPLLLRRKLEDPSCWMALQQRFKRSVSHGTITDVYDGAAYQEYTGFLQEPANVSFVCNTDGVAIFRSSSVSIWPVWLVRNELPPQIRFAKKSMILAGLWYSAEKPTMSMYLQPLRPLVDTMNELFVNGILVNTPDGAMRAHAVILMSSVDLPARVIVANMKQFNGKFGCIYCEDEGITVDRNYLVRYWPMASSSTPHSHDSIMDNARTATLNKEATKGIKGPCILDLHQPFDMARGFTVDDLHCIYLGVTLKMMHLWFDKVNRQKPYYIGNKTSLCDERLLSIKVPDIMSRVPKSIAIVGKWKGSELRNWLLFFAIPVLFGILPPVYLSHLALLVSAMHILSSCTIPTSDLERSRMLLHRFYDDYSSLYGVENTTMNVHMLSHVVNCVANWGPLWCYSCFPFEGMNGTFKSFFHGTRNMNEQMVFSYTMMQVLPGIDLNASPAVQSVLDVLTGQKKDNIKQVLPGPSLFVIGGMSLKSLDGVYLEEVNALLDVPLPSASTVQVFYRLRRCNEVFYSAQYGRVKKRNSFTVVYSCGDGLRKFGFIQYFYIIEEKIFALIQVVTLLQTTCKEHFQISTDCLDEVIVPVSSCSQFEVVPVCRISAKCVCVNNVYIVTCSSLSVFFD